MMLYYSAENQFDSNSDTEQKKVKMMMLYYSAENQLIL